MNPPTPRAIAVRTFGRARGGVAAPWLLKRWIL